MPANYKARALADTLVYDLANRTGLAAALAFDAYSNPVIRLGTPTLSGKGGATIRFLNQMGGMTTATTSGSMFGNSVGNDQPVYTLGTVELIIEATGKVSTAAVQASGTLTCATVVATDTCAVAGVTFTAVADNATPTATQFRIGTDDTSCAANLAAAINANATTSQYVIATSALGVVTIKALNAGVVGNLIAISGGQSTITASAATLASGAGGSYASFTSFDRILEIVGECAKRGLEIIITETNANTAPLETASTKTQVAFFHSSLYFPGFAA